MYNCTYLLSIELMKIEGHISLLDGANMIQFMGRRNQIKIFVRFKADRSLKCFTIWFLCISRCLPMKHARLIWFAYLVSLLITGTRLTKRISNTILTNAVYSSIIINLL